MSMQSLEREIVYEARTVLNNAKLRTKDLQEWATHEIQPQDGETVIHIAAGLNVWIAVKKECDKRKSP
jgi:hypothetical protein